jgi:aryl-phospho-beta-D-glucosidase BglC (GH1 family)
MDMRSNFPSSSFNQSLPDQQNPIDKGSGAWLNDREAAMPAARSMSLTRRNFGNLMAGALTSVALGPASVWASAARPRWRGFNLLEKFIFQGKHEAYREDDFRRLRDWGFNFVRLPLDYRGYVDAGDWKKFLEHPLRQIDEAVAMGEKYGVHVCLNLHRAPGYTVAKPPEAKNLWTDATARDAAAAHWRMFARRYREVPGDRLSFNLFNEPSGVEEMAYVRVMRRMVETIREEDAERPIWSDGLEWGRQPISTCRELGVGMMTRGYDPFQLTHYGAPWVNGERFPEPRWPAPMAICGTLLSPSRPDHSHAITLDGELPAGTRLRVRVQHVTTGATLVVLADGREIFRRHYPTGPEGKGEWKRSEWLPEWKIHRSFYETDESIALAAPASRLSLRVVDGDWMQLGEIGLRLPGGPELVQPLKEGWQEKPEPLRLVPAADGKPPRLGPAEAGVGVLEKSLEPWLRFRKEGGQIMVGEWGAFNRVPHPVMLAWATDQLRLWKENNVGWALWNLRGSFGPLDSGRNDVRYEKEGGVLVDRAFLELLRAY